MSRPSKFARVRNVPPISEVLSGEEEQDWIITGLSGFFRFVEKSTNRKRCLSVAPSVHKGNDALCRSVNP